MIGTGLGRWSLALLALSLAAAPRTGRAAEATRVVSAFDEDNPYDLNLTLTWLREWKSAVIKRESEGSGSSAIALVNDLRYAQTRDILNPRVDFGIFRDVGVHIEAPIVLDDNRSLSFDPTASGCTFPGQTITGQPMPCSSSILQSGILPGGGTSQYGIDAQHGGRAFASPSSTIFRGPTRSGIEYLGLGVNWAVFNQARDDTKPTWMLGFDSRLDVGKDMRFDPLNSGGNTAVGLGYHQLVFSTTVSKKFRYFDPYFGAWFMQPIRSDGSPYQHYSTGSQTSVDPQQQAGAQFGVEQIAWEDPTTSQRVTIEFRGHATEHFFGRSQSELWEALSGSPQCGSANLAVCRPGIDFDGSGNPAPYPGVTETEAYASYGGDAGVNIQVGKYIRFRGLFGLTIDTPHFITYANAGTPLPGSNTVDLGDPNQRNPVYRDTIDNPGRRFWVEGTEIWSLLLEGSIMF